MTLAQAFLTKTELTIEVATDLLLFEGLDPNQNWDPEDKDLKCKFYKVLLGHLSKDQVGIKSISEGGYSISYDSLEKAKHLSLLALESACPCLINQYNPQPKIRNKSNIW